MSLKFFFNRKGGVVLGLNAVGWALNIWSLCRLPQEWSVRGGYTGISFLVYLFLCLLITMIRFIPWYGSDHRGHGIELHFEKTLVPLGYLMLATNAVYLSIKVSWPLITFFILLLLSIQAVNGILIYFHFRDKDPEPPSFLTRSLRE